MAEICTGIIVVSLPALRPLLRRASHVVHPPPPSSHAMTRAWMNNRKPSGGGHGSQPRFSSSRTAGPSRSKNDVRAIVAPPEGYHYTYETDTAASDVELHGGLMKSDVESRTEEINVYTDAKEVLGHHNREEKGMPPLQRNSDAKAWVQRTRQFS
jgi:hypothetical protein